MPDRTPTREIDLDDPVALTASVGNRNAREYRISLQLVRARPEYHEGAFERNPNIAGMDTLLRVPLLPIEGGQVAIDLGARAAELKAQMDGPTLDALVVVSCESRLDPSDRFVTADAVRLKRREGGLALRGIVTQIARHEWVRERSAFLVELVVEGPQKTVLLGMEPRAEGRFHQIYGVWAKKGDDPRDASGALLGGLEMNCENKNPWPMLAVEVPVAAGTTSYVVGVGAPFPGASVLSARGTGKYADLKAAIELRREGSPE